MLFRQKQELVISEPDIEAALKHLKALPYRHKLPGPWERQHLLNLLREAIGSTPKSGDQFPIAPGVYALITSFGVDLAAGDETEWQPDGRLQVWLLIRPGYTDPARVTSLA